ncbi:hypothetical protein LCM28_08380 [Salipiger pacificus]|nr:hypothetical protein [Alloyangia pacifica]
MEAVMEQFGGTSAGWEAMEIETPFGDPIRQRENSEPSSPLDTGLTPWNESASSLADDSWGEAPSESEALIAELLAELRDEAFDEALLGLAEETEMAVADRFTSETVENAGERERFAEMQLEGLRFEAESYLDRLHQGIAETDFASLSDAQLDQFLERFDPDQSDLTPAGEEFIGGLIKKARKAVKWVAKKAKSVARTIGKAGSKLLGPVLKRLKGLVRPLLKRVLGFAIGKLPAPLQPIARKLATRLRFEAEGEDEGEARVFAEQLDDMGELAQSFDMLVAEAVIDDEMPDGFGKAEEDEASVYAQGANRPMKLAEARGTLLRQLREAEARQDLSPEIEQFVPALLGALRIGIRLVGRPKVVNFLARFIAQLIQRWVGPKLSNPLSRAIVDAGLRLISLEAEAEAEGALDEDRVATEALAAVIEDTVRRFAENEAYVLDDEELVRIAAGEAFSGAVATFFPSSLIKESLQEAPSLGGVFVPQRMNELRPYARYSRVPEVTITEQMAEALPAFGGEALGAVIGSAELGFPLRGRLHLVQAMSGTTPSQILRRLGLRHGAMGTAALQPLTRAAAGVLLQEPRLGTDGPKRRARRPGLSKPGDRYYVIEPLGQGGTGRRSRPADASRFRQHVDATGRSVVLSYYLSERRAQRVALEMKSSASAAALARTLIGMMGGLQRRGGSPLGEVEAFALGGLAGEELSLSSLKSALGGLKGGLARRIRQWTLPALVAWLRDNSEVFQRAVQHPAQGVTLTVRLTEVPGLSLIANPSKILTNPGALKSAFAGKPAIAIALNPGRPK